MSRGFLLDTNILSETLRPFPDAKVVAWLDSLSKDIQFVSVVTLGELRRGTALLPEGGKRTKLEEFIDVMRSYGDIDVTRSGGVAMSLEAKKLRLQPPVPTRAAGAREEPVVNV